LVSRGLSLRKEPAFPESRKKIPRFEGRTGSLTWNKVRRQQARTGRANGNRPDSGIVRMGVKFTPVALESQRAVSKHEPFDLQTVIENEPTRFVRALPGSL
jgi:hypothetical protein